jgi:hypothetical protein
MGRRGFIKRFFSAFLGVLAGQFVKVDHPRAKAEMKPPLHYRMLGRTGLKVTTVGMGVMNCSDPSVLHRAYDLGINFYDTADCYMGGRNEEMVGKVFKGKRENVIIQTKVHDHDEKRMRASVERSLRRLQTDYIDVLVWHGLSSTDEVSDPRLFEFMAKMKKEGKARFTGFSTHTRMARLLREAAEGNYHDVVLTSYNFTHSRELKEALASAAKSGIGIVAMKTQAGGYKKGGMEGQSPHQAALAYVLNDPHVATAVPGATTIGQIEECAAVMGKPFSHSDLYRLKEYQAYLQGRICTLCGGCQGECPHGVRYGDFLRSVMYHEGYRNEALAREAYRKACSWHPVQVCSECSSCSVVCRRGLDIQEQLLWAQRLFEG